MIYIDELKIEEPKYEFVERKGIGHPDTLADALAEKLSVNYSKYTLEKFGAILHHNFDKVGLLGGASYVKFGEGHLAQPIRVLLNGRASTSFGGVEIPIKALLIQWSRDFMSEMFPMIDPYKDLDFHYNLSNKSSPGKTDEKNSEKGTRKFWFEPRDLNDLSERQHLVSNDTSMGVGYAPYTRLEKFIIDIESDLNSKELKKLYPWLGSDIKIMGFRHVDQFNITMCIPQISKYVSDISEYKQNLLLCRKRIMDIAQKTNITNLELYINTRDDFTTSELYLTAIGSSIESGDEGLVGRGNRINGVISPMQLMSMEGACGKNPVYHIGKIYYVAAQQISNKIYSKFGIRNQVVLVSQSGRNLLDPWIVFVNIPPKSDHLEEIKKLVEQNLQSIPEITNQLLKEEMQLF